MYAHGKFWILKEGTLEVLYKSDFDKAIERAVKEVEEIGLKVTRAIAISIALKGLLYMQD